MAGRYIDNQDLFDTWDEDNIIAWSNKDNSATTINQAAVDRSIKLAENKVDGYFRDGRYRIPFVGTLGELIPEEVKWWAAAFAGRWLYITRGIRNTETNDKIKAVQDEVMAELNMYSGEGAQHRLNAEFNVADEPDAPTVVRD